MPFTLKLAPAGIFKSYNDQILTYYIPSILFIYPSEFGYPIPLGCLFNIYRGLFGSLTKYLSRITDTNEFVMVNSLLISMVIVYVQNKLNNPLSMLTGNQD